VEGAGRKRRWALASILGATFMLLVDVTIVQVALPSIQRDLSASFAGLQWVIDAYAITLAALLLGAGQLADRFSRKRVFVGGVVVFTGASLLCGLASSSLTLDLARAAQGVGGAAMFTTSLALIGQEFEGHARHTALALWGATIGGAVAIGPLLGGLLTEWLSWHWIFYVNLPVGIAVVAASVAIRDLRSEQVAHTDLAGLACFSGFLFLLVYGLLRGNDDGWTSAQIVGSLGGAALLLAAFVVVELRQEHPMFDLSLLRSPAFTGVSLGTFAIGAGMFALLPYLTLYLQNDLGYSPLEGGIRLLPTTLLVFFVPIAARRLGTRIPAAVMLAAGLGIVFAGVLLMLRTGADSAWTVLLPGEILAGLGIGLANPAIGQLALMVVPSHRVGLASGLSNTFRIGGLATGVAGLGALLDSRLTSRLHELLPAAPHGLAAAVASGGVDAAAALVPPAARAQTVAAAHVAFVSGLDLAFLAGAVAVALGTLAVAVLARPSLVAVAAGAPERAPDAEPVLDQ